MSIKIEAATSPKRFAVSYAQGDEASYQQKRDDHMLHYSSPGFPMKPMIIKSLVASIEPSLCKIAHFGLIVPPSGG
jgi:hypothetical protein